jgi:hypothetical protein
MAVLGILILWAAGMTVVVASGRARRVSALLFAAILIPLATRGILTSIGYVGIAHLSAADIQFLRATQWVGSGQPLGAESARLTLYPTSFLGLAGVHAATGISVETLLEWSWMVAIPIAVAGTFLFVRELTGSSEAGALSSLAAVGNPWIVSQPVYDGLNLALLPLWAYVMVRRRRDGRRRPVVLSLLLLTVMISAHFFSALFLVLVGFAIGASTCLFDASGPEGARHRLAGALGSGLQASALPIAAVAAWLTYIAGRYLAESEGLIRAFLGSLIGQGLGGASLPSVLSPWQLVTLGIAAAAYALLAGVAFVSWVRFGDRLMGLSITLALFALPLVIWAIVTPLGFASGIDLKEWKVRPLAAAFLLCAPVVGIALREIHRRWHHRLAYPILLAAAAAIFTNSVTLWFSYGAAGPAVISGSASPTVVEDTGITPDEYRLLGDFVRQSVSQERYLLSDWHQLTWMVGAGGLVHTPDYRTAAFTDPRETLWLSARYGGIAVDRNLLSHPSVYIAQPARAAAMASLEQSGLDRVFDSGSQVLYVSPNPPS